MFSLPVLGEKKESLSLVPQKKASLFALDADGCLYNYKYHQLLRYIAAKYWDFLKTHQEWPPKKIQLKIQEIKQDIVHFTFKPKEASWEDYLDDLNQVNPHFYEEVEALSENKQIDLVQAFHLKVGFLIPTIYQLIGNDPDKNILKWVLEKSNEPLIQELTKIAKTGQAFSFISASSRGDNQLNNLGMEQGTGSIFIDLHNLHEIVKEKVNDHSIASHVSQFAKADIDGDYLIGTTIKAILKAGPCQEDVFNHDGYQYDHTKFSLLFAICQYANNEFRIELKLEETDEIDIFYFDDLDEILDVVNNRFKQYPDFLSKNVNLITRNYRGEFAHPQQDKIIGTSCKNTNYRAMAKLILTCSDVDVDHYDANLHLNFNLFARCIKAIRSGHVFSGKAPGEINLELQEFEYIDGLNVNKRQKTNSSRFFCRTLATIPEMEETFNLNKNQYSFL